MVVKALPIVPWPDEVRDRALTGMLIVQCLTIFIAAPVAATGYPGSHLVLEFLFVVFTALIVVISRGPTATIVAALAMILTLLGLTFMLFEPIPSLVLLSRIGNTAGALVVGVVVGRAVLAPGKITFHRVVGAIVLYLTFGMIFTATYRLVWDLDPGSLSGIPSGTDPAHAAGTILYFSFSTLTTVGYGDIIPVHPLVRSLTNLESIIGQLYPATLLARLITLELEARRHQNRA
jgi:hypothetical protein